MDKGFKIDVLDKGYVTYVDNFGNDLRIVEAARVSYDSPSKGDYKDKQLLHYLYKNRHCYHPSMQVLTADGWVKWSDCKEYTNFIVPNHISKTYTVETLKIEKFDCHEKLVTFKNNRMSFKVTKDHRMLIKLRNRADWQIMPAKDIIKTGNHFCGITGFKSKMQTQVQKSNMFCLLGFYLGDGTAINKSRCLFHLKKVRKINYLLTILRKLNIEFKIYPGFNNAIQISFVFPNELKTYTNFGARTKNKELSVPISSLSAEEISGLFDGLVNSDGSIKLDRPQIEYSSSSYKLAKLFEMCGFYMGYDTHFCKSLSEGIYSIKAYSNKGRTSLETRIQYFGEETYNGQVYCATTSTGLLIVRGSDTEFGFICGNTSPFEQCAITYEIKLPLFVQAQLVRHRTQKLNQMSARYTEMPDEFYIPKSWRPQDKKNKQGSVESEDWNPILQGNNQDYSASDRLYSICNYTYEVYKEMLAAGISKEMARMHLPQNLYTKIYSCWDIHNLIHMFGLRLDLHAQWEIRQYAQAMYDIFANLYPWTAEAYEKYKFILLENDSQNFLI